MGSSIFRRLIAVGVTLLLIRGIKESASFNSIIVIIKVIVVIIFIVAGIGYVNTNNLGIGRRRKPGLCRIYALWISGRRHGSGGYFLRVYRF